MLELRPPAGMGWYRMIKPVLRFHYVKRGFSSSFGLLFVLRYLPRITGISLVTNHRELAIGRCMTFKKLAKLMEALNDKT